MFYIRILILFLFSATVNEVGATLCDSFIASNHFNKDEIDNEIELLKQNIKTINPTINFENWVCQKRILANAYVVKRFYKLAIVQLLEILDNQILNPNSKNFGIVYIELGKCYEKINENDKTLKHLLNG